MFSAHALCEYNVIFDGALTFLQPRFHLVAEKYGFQLSPPLLVLFFYILFCIIIPSLKLTALFLCVLLCFIIGLALPVMDNCIW